MLAQIYPETQHTIQSKRPNRDGKRNKQTNAVIVRTGQEHSTKQNKKKTNA